MISTDDRFENDRLRRTRMGSRRIQFSPQIIALGRSRIAEILLAIRRFRAFLDFLDFDGDHSRGEFDFAGLTIRFEIKAYPRIEVGFLGDQRVFEAIRVLTVSVAGEFDHE